MSDQVSADVVIVGAGICGALAAHRLAKAGASVLMLEAGPRIDRGQITAAFRGSARKSDANSLYPMSPLAPYPDYEPLANPLGWRLPADMNRSLGVSMALAARMKVLPVTR